MTATTFEHIPLGTEVFVLEHDWQNSRRIVKHGVISQAEFRVTKDGNFLIYLILLDDRNFRGYWRSQEVFTNFESAERAAKY